VAFLSANDILFGKNTKLMFGELYLDLGFIYYPLAILFILGIINCANLTDGVDGLAASVSFAISVSTFLLSLGNREDTLIIASIGIGATLGFLFFNIHPAKIFMGDTGSLFLGALCVCYAFSTNSLPAFILIGGVYVIEGISVIAQVLFYKTTGKRILKMAPLHHHVEKCGFDESKICIYAMLTTFLLSIVASVIMGGGR
jgi:phospho-N-acetylmuramoyl-pentapeptide-transferase